MLCGPHWEVPHRLGSGQANEGSTPATIHESFLKRGETIFQKVFFFIESNQQFSEDLRYSLGFRRGR